jgi:NAD(P)-dependent dehydrogenase (short-subunit alcohol dehydrogenase family)
MQATRRGAWHHDSMELRDKVVIVTGGGNGIGAALCKRFITEGAAEVVVADLDGDAATAVAEEIGATAAQLDVSDEAATRELVADVERRHGRIDLYCANAGIAAAQGLDMSNELWQKTWEVNVLAHVYAARAILPGMLERGDGYFLATVSAAGLLTNIGAAAYSVTKHGALAHAEWLSVTYGDQGLKVSALCPQFVETRMIEDFSTLEMDDSFIRSVAVTTDDVAASVVDGLAAEKFLILPHPEVQEYFRNKANDHDRWIGGMRKLQRAWMPKGMPPPA